MKRKIVIKEKKYEDTLEMMSGFFVFLGIQDDIQMEKYIRDVYDIRETFQTKEEVIAKLDERLKDKKIDKKHIRELQQIVDEYDDKIFEIFDDIFEMKLDVKNVKGLVSFNPICPRYLNEKEFDIYWRAGNMHINTIVLHELSHFYFFEKYKLMHPEISEDEYEAPTSLWLFSEILVDSLLNDSRFNFIEKDQCAAYKYFYKVNINGEYLIERFRKKYNESKNIEEFLDKGYQYVNKYRSIILSFK